MKNLHNALLLKQLYRLKQLGYRYTDITLPRHDTTPLILPHSMEALLGQATTCHLCELSKSRHHVVFGKGALGAKLFIVGEAPSVGEDGSGEIFTGRSGELLDAMIGNVLGLRREEVYLSNLVKCHPYGGQSPSPSQIHTCLAYLKREIDIVKPTLIVTLGVAPYGYLTGEHTDIHTIRGTVKKMENYTIVPTYHPSYLLRNPSAKKEAFSDMKLIKSLLEMDVTQ